MDVQFRRRKFWHRIPIWARRSIVLGVVALLLLAGGFVAQQVGRSRVRPLVRIASAAPEQGVSVRLVGDNGTEAQGVTPWEVSLPPGEYRYTAVAPGYRMASGTVRIAAGPTSAVQIPPLEQAAGMIEVRSNALVSVSVDGTKVGQAGPDPSRWVSFGPYAEGLHVVRATAALGTQEVSATVSAQFAAKVEFLWGSRLVVRVEPADIPSVTVAVDGVPYAGPKDFSARQLSSRPYAGVAVTAPGYTAWSDTVFLTPGSFTTVTALLTPTGVLTETQFPPSDAEEQVLAAFWNVFTVLGDAYERLDASSLSSVLTGEQLAWEEETVAMLRWAGYPAVLLSVTFPTTPTVQVLADGTAEVSVTEFIQQLEYVFTDGTHIPVSTSFTATFRFLRGDDGVWRLASVESTEIPSPTPTPKPGGGGGGGGGSRPQPADRGLVAQLILESINCNRSVPARWDPELAAVLAQYVDNQMGLQDALAGLQPRAWIIGNWGEVLSYSPANARYGEFAYDWENYVGRACDIHYADPWAHQTLPYSSIGVAIGEPYWDGVVWKAWTLIAGR